MAERLIIKKRGQRAHFKKRLQERYLIECNRGMYRLLVGQVHDGKAKFLKKQSNSKIVFEVYACDKPVWAVYDRTTKEFRTALKLGCDLRDVDDRGRTIPRYLEG